MTKDAPDFKVGKIITTTQVFGLGLIFCIIAFSSILFTSTHDSKGTPYQSRDYGFLISIAFYIVICTVAILSRYKRRKVVSLLFLVIAGSPWIGFAIILATNLRQPFVAWATFSCIFAGWCISFLSWAAWLKGGAKKTAKKTRGHKRG